MVSVLASLALAAVLLAAAGLKLHDRDGSLVGLATYGLRGLSGRIALAAVVGAELLLGVALLAGSRAAAWGAAVLLTAFAAAQLATLAAGRGGAPCGCGGGGRLGWPSLARVGLLAGGAWALAAFGHPGSHGAPSAGAGLAVAAVAVALLRRARPDGALDVAGEGPEIGERLPLPGDGLRLALFTSASCGLCARLRPAAARLGVPVVELDEQRDANAWAGARVPGSPYAVVLDAGGTVRAKGTVNTRRQLASLVAVMEPAGSPQSRRHFLERAAGAAAALTAGRTVGALVAPGEADAFHFCGHIYTTDGCPHPTGLPRIDSKGFPLRARDGHRVDDLGRLVDVGGLPVGEDGARLLDADGQLLPPATRTRVCTATGQAVGRRLRVDGAWYRCCGGHVRRLIDCCTTGTRRINGDGALHGYCYSGRRVFCVMYYQTRVPC